MDTGTSLKQSRTSQIHRVKMWYIQYIPVENGEWVAIEEVHIVGQFGGLGREPKCESLPAVPQVPAAGHVLPQVDILTFPG